MKNRNGVWWHHRRSETFDGWIVYGGVGDFYVWKSVPYMPKEELNAIRDDMLPWCIDEMQHSLKLLTTFKGNWNE